MQETTLRKVKKNRIFWLYDTLCRVYIPFKKLQYDRSKKAFVVQMMVYKDGELVAYKDPMLMHGSSIVCKRRKEMISS